ncbi:MAG: TIR domain-containing protein [Candidatus Helarchaeota archaeon]|nr:TIR domain-containing protein [Candidatus Helarchaeota archaeon]
MKMEINLTIFISYAMADKKLKIAEIAAGLEEKGIEKVHYWEGWHGYLDGDIISFMEDNIKVSDIFIAVCTEASNASENCGKERKMAVFQNKRLIPLFDDFGNVPATFQPYIGVNMTGKDVSDIVDEVHELIQKGREEVVSAPSVLKKSAFFAKQVNIDEIQVLKAIQKELNHVLKGCFKVDEHGYVTSLNFTSITLDSIPKSIYSLKNLIAVNFSGDSFESDDGVRNLLYDGKEIFIHGKPYVEGQIEERVRIDSQRSHRLKEKFKVSSEQITVLEELQKLLDKELPNEDEIGWSDYGIKVKNKGVVTLGLASRNIPRLPDDIGNLDTLVDLFMKFNDLSALPDSIGNLKKVKRLSFMENQLTVLPESFGNMESLQECSLSRNHFKTLPESFGNLKSILTLWLYSNDLESLPASFGNLKTLEKLYIYENDLTHLPKSFGTLISLQELDICRNRLTTLPESFGNLDSLLKLDLSRNALESIPESFGSLDLLMKLNLSYNQLKSLPESIGNLELLVDLNVSENYDITHLPESIGNLKSLVELNLQYLGLLELPESFGGLESLRILSMIDNKLTSLPNSFGDLKSLIMLNIKGNKFETLPESLLDLPNLKVLNVQNNPLKPSAATIIRKLIKKRVKVIK